MCLPEWAAGGHKPETRVPAPLPPVLLTLAGGWSRGFLISRREITDVFLPDL